MKTYKILLSTLIAAAAASAVPAFATNRIESYEEITLDGNGDFTGNEAPENRSGYDGGAIYCLSSVTISGEEYSFYSNRAMDCGGAIFAEGSVTISGGTNTFTKNEAGYDGGAIYAGGDVNISGGTNTFTKNEAADEGGSIFEEGGAIFAEGSVTISGGTNTFTENTAAYEGGAISAYGGNVVFSGNGTTATFSGNTADGSPNDIYSYESVTIKDAGTYSFDGGIVVTDGSVLSIESGASVTFTGSAKNIIKGATTISGTGTNVSFGENTTTTTSGLSVTGGATIEVGGSVTVSGDFTVYSDSTLKYTGTNRISVLGTTTISGTVVFAADSAESVSLAQAASVSVSDGAVKLTAAAAAITVNSVSKMDAASVSLGNNVETIAAWDFDIANAESMVTVSIAIDSGITPEDVTVYHQNASGDWENVTSSVSLTVANGIATFSTANFSAYALGVASAIPEPSAFGLLAGIGALTLAISRRRRSRKA